MAISKCISKFTLRAKRATFYVLHFFQPFLSFEKLFRPLKMSSYSKLSYKKHIRKGLQSFQKDKKGFAKHKNIFTQKFVWDIFANFQDTVIYGNLKIDLKIQGLSSAA